MENLDIIILTSIVSTLFIVFGITTIREVKRSENKPINKEGGPRANFIRFIGNQFDEEVKKIKK